METCLKLKALENAYIDGVIIKKRDVILDIHFSTAIEVHAGEIILISEHNGEYSAEVYNEKELH